MTDIRRIRFKSDKLNELFREEREHLIIVNGAITTRSKLENFDVSLAHLKHGEILRYGRVIGSESDIEFGEVVQ